MRVLLTGVALCAGLAISSTGHAAGNPVVVEYTAPPECASNEAFHALLQAQIAQNENPERPWRFSVSIRHESDYVGVVKTETGTRELRAPTCDDVTAALSLVIAMAQPDLPAPPPPPPIPVEPPPTPTPPPAFTLTPPLPHTPALTLSPDRIADESHTPGIDWRVGLRAQNWQDGSTITASGATATLSAELPWGFPKMMFEVGAGMLVGSSTRVPMLFASQALEPWLVVDVQACPIDLPLGSTGVSVLGCARMAVGLVDGVAGWGGGGARLRWQSPWHLFVEAHGNGMYGTKIQGVPALMDFGGSVGFRI